MTTPEPTPEQLDATRHAMRQEQPTPEEMQAAWDALRRAMEPLVQMIEHTAAAAAKVAQVLAEALAKEQTKADYTLIPAGITELHKPVDGSIWTALDGWHEGQMCETCREHWPCGTVEIITSMDR